ncbi:DUF2752 domain-containing protein [Aureisphaera galaxeae]|uniref:DUF2752 domain-containing protein n=1 Tax=Aureisphaera galaxeae TaxID=1538023 RepID=UPI0023508EE0|nr:DUF2752 domain-containing protein [Aureisphaera galaxeae]MDC8004401.1 DUF2752 domain-containing protein [Aureisphaera galaxeae]
MEEHMLPCLNKQLFGIDCLGCGIQRAAVLLFRGEFVAAFKMYPAIYTLFILALFLILNFFVTIKHARIIKMVLIIANLLIIVIGYIVKMSNYV